ncbi:MAG TPA: GTP pyrophosphokinase, partial [Lactobacillus sp.]|nr:GTP pyrophosphokinase [Lactobacillus sp.]
KYQGEFPQELQGRLERAGEAAFRLDQEMSAIRADISEAQPHEDSNSVHTNDDDDSSTSFTPKS